MDLVRGPTTCAIALTMALITSDCSKMRLPAHQMVLITSNLCARQAPKPAQLGLLREVALGAAAAAAKKVSAKTGARRLSNNAMTPPVPSPRATRGGATPSAPTR